MKKVTAILLEIVMSLALISTASAHSLWDIHWTPGEYVPEMTEEKIQELTELKEKALKMSEWAPARSLIDTYEEQYKMQQSLGAEVEAFEEYFDDIGKYAFYFGLPDDLVITEDQAWLIAYQALIEQGVVEKEELLYYFPQCFYVVYDTEHTVWFFSFASWDGQIRPILTVGVFAADGSIFGIKCSKADSQLTPSNVRVPPEDDPNSSRPDMSSLNWYENRAAFILREAGFDHGLMENVEAGYDDGDVIVTLSNADNSFFAYCMMDVDGNLQEFRHTTNPWREEEIVREREDITNDIVEECCIKLNQYMETVQPGLSSRINGYLLDAIFQKNEETFVRLEDPSTQSIFIVRIMPTWRIDVLHFPKSNG